MCPPVMASQSGARRWRGSAICGPLKVSRLTLTSLNESLLDGTGVGEAASERGGTLAASDGETLAASLAALVGGADVVAADGAATDTAGADTAAADAAWLGRGWVLRGV